MATLKLVAFRRDPNGAWLSLNSMIKLELKLVLQNQPWKFLREPLKNRICSAWADGRFLKAQKEFLNGGVSNGYAERRTFFHEPKRTATPGRQILMDYGVVANTVTARYGAVTGICS